MSYTIYKITNKINNKIYVGQTTRSLKARMSQYKWCVKNYITNNYNVGTVIIPAMAKHGFDNFAFEIIKICKTIDELNLSEIELIKELNSLVPNGYNIELGGKNSPVLEYTRNKISEAQIGSKNHRFGKSNSKEHNEAIRKASTGRKQTDEAKRKIIYFLTGKPKSEDIRNKISKSLMGKPNFKLRKLTPDQEKEIYLKYITGNFSQKDLSVEYSVGETTIGRAVKKHKIIL